MALTKIGIDAISGAIGTTQLTDNSVTSAKIANGAVAKEELDVGSAGAGTGALIPPKGTTAQRPTAVAGQLRFNTTLNLMEYYDGTNWKSIDAPPVITSISGTINENTDSTITINGSNFQSGAVVYIEGAAVSNVARALTTTVVNSTQCTAVTNAAAVNYVGGGSYDVRVTNSSGLSSLSSSVGAVDRDPTWTTASGNIGTIYDSARGTSGTIATVVATDPESTSVTYAVTTGSLPSGLSLNSSTGVISSNGTVSSVGSDTTTTFSITPTSNGQAGIARSFNIVVKAPVITSFTSTGSSTWSVPTGVSSVQVLVVAGGGAGGCSTGSAINGGGGGAGGLVLHNTFPVTPGGSVSYTVGAGGNSTWFNPSPGLPGAVPSSYNDPGQGGDTIFGSLTAKGGGIGGSGEMPGLDPLGGNLGRSGGSGGGNAGWGQGGTPGQAGGTGNQPAQSNPGATVNGGYPGGQGGNPNTVAGGGGGATARGTGAQDTNSAQGNGGAGYSSSISGSSVTYAGGGGAGGYPGTVATAGTGGAGGGGNGANGGLPSNTAPSGTTNRGGGGGGCSGYAGGGNKSYGGAGGPGIIIVKY